MRLQSGARIAVVAPAGLFAAERLQRGMDVVRSWGYELIEGQELFAKARYTAGSVAQRSADLNWALTAPDIDAVWFARGGFGTAHLLPLVPWQQLDGRPVIGFSDATALLNGLRQRGLPAIHGPVLQTLSNDAFGAPGAVLVDDASRRALQDLLGAGKLPDLPGELLCGPARPVRGPLVGGNLTVLASLAGTPWGAAGAGRDSAAGRGRRGAVSRRPPGDAAAAVGGAGGRAGRGAGRFPGSAHGRRGHARGAA